MRKIILVLFLSFNFSYAIPFDCKDGNYKIIFNIDHNSLHFMVQGNIYEMKYDNLKKTGKNRILGFKRFNAMFYAYYNIEDPYHLTIREYRSKSTGGKFDIKDNKLMYSYNCVQDSNYRNPNLYSLYK